MARQKKTGEQAQRGIARNIDKLASYDEFVGSVTPRLQKAVLEKWSPEKIYKEFGGLVASKAVAMALSSESDPGKALAAIQEVLNRGFGKATEKLETTHKYTNLDDKSLDSLLESAMKSAAEDKESEEVAH